MNEIETRCTIAMARKFT